ncbi:MAG: sortase [Propionibacteriaceae bacterium]|nr:sortase [Propionibacteriaceae bacterium]
MPTRRPNRRPVTWVLVALIATVAAWLGYQYGLSNVTATYRADRALEALRQDWAERGVSSAAGAPVWIGDGEAFAIIRIPAFSASYAWPVSSGMGALDRGFAWYPESAQPGQIGNFALACHRITHGAPCAGLTGLKAGDTVTVETRDATYTYSIVVPASELTVSEDAGWVLDPVPGKGEAVPWEPILTITTAQDLVSSPDRSVAFGVLTSKEMKK